MTAVIFNFGVEKAKRKSGIKDTALLEDMVAEGFDPCDPIDIQNYYDCLLYTSPSPRDVEESRMPSSA